jgi:hypothetical protein
VRSW